MFNNAQNIHIANGSFNNTTHLNTVNGSSLDKLFDRVASNAILNAGGRPDEPRCHPGTREEVIGRIEKWGDAQDVSTPPIFWLSGPAGAGKSAIVQTFAERCEQRGVPHANFFFFRTDGTRSKVNPLIATLVYQLISLYPSLRDHITTLLLKDPLVTNSRFKDQLARLIVAPLRAIQKSSPTYRPVLFLIDGLDECDSKSKRSQQQILDAFDAVITELPAACPFRLLVSSRNESQIQSAFNKLSSSCLRLYLDDTYSPENDIRKFVAAEFKQLWETHPLRHLLKANWPPDQDIDYIVQKSSGQFIFAATVMRFMSESPAAPTISLERIKGAAQLSTKSPFSNLDAIYAYILLQVDDQDALKDILNAQLLLDSMMGVRISTRKLLGMYNQKYTKAMVLSCLADLNPIGQFSKGRLRFYHASFPDFLLDQLRSSDHFVDVPAFNYKLLSIVCEYYSDFSAAELPLLYTDFCKAALRRLNKLPPGLLDTLGSFSQTVRAIDAYKLWGKIYELCVSDDDIASFRYLIRHWIGGDRSYLASYKTEIRRIPFGSRYYEMAWVEIFWTISDASAVADLRPESDFDRHESAVWLNDLLHDMQQKIYLADPAHYRELVKAWIVWAVQNDIPVDGTGDTLDRATSNDTQQIFDVLHSRRYFSMARIQRDYTAVPSGEDIAALHPRTDADRREISVWLQDLLDHINSERYIDDERSYRGQLKEWIIWGVQNDIPLDLDRPLTELDAAMPYGTRKFANIPYSRRYFAMARINYNHTTLPRGDMLAALHPETDVDRRELALWVTDILHRIHGSLYHGDPKSYREILESWVSWAAQNDIPLDGGTPDDTVESVDIPYYRRYLAMARIEHGHATLPDAHIASSLSPESDFDRHESALWLEDLLHDIHGELHSTNPKGGRELLAAWISWAVWNGISCDGLSDLPGAQWYMRVNTLQKWAADAFNRWQRG